MSLFKLKIPDSSTDYALFLNSENGALYSNVPIDGVKQRVLVHDPSAVASVANENNSLVFKNNSGATIVSIPLGSLTAPTLTDETIDAICV